MSLLGCISGQSQAGKTYHLKIHPGGIFWQTIGSGQFVTLTESSIEVTGSVSLLGVSSNFDVIITDGSSGQPILTVDGQADPGATLSGCTIQAKDTLGGLTFTVSPDEDKTKVVVSGPYPAIYITD